MPAFPTFGDSRADAETKTDTQDPVLAAIAALSARFDTLATKDDLSTLRTDLEKHTDDTVQAAVNPVRQEVQELRVRVRTLETAGSGGTWKEKDRADPARKQVAVLGWPEEWEGHRRLNTLEEWVKTNFPNSRATGYTNEYKGDYNNRVVAKAAYVNFASEDEARNLTKGAKDRNVQLVVNGKTLREATRFQPNYKEI